MKRFGTGAALAGALFVTDPTESRADTSPDLTPVVSGPEYTPDNVDLIIADIQARAAAASAECFESFNAEEISMAEFGECDLEVAKQQTAELDNLEAAMNREFAAIELEHANLSNFLGILYQLQLVAAEAGNDAAIARIQDLRAEALTTLTSGETVEEMTERLGAEADRIGAEADRIGAEADRIGAEADRIGAEADRVTAENDRLRAETEAFRAQSAYYEAQIQAIWDDISSSNT